MHLRRQIIARKYAQAFMRLHCNDLTTQSFSHLRALASFCEKNKKFLIFLSISSIPFESKQKALEQVANTLKLEPFTKRLLDVLLEKRRIHLLSLIIRNIAELYKDHAGIRSFTIFTSHDLSSSQKETITQFLQTAVPQQTVLRIKFNIDHSLISGIRIRSKTQYWEYSLAHQLKALKQNLYQRVGL